MLKFKYKNDINAQIEYSSEDRRDFDILREYFKTENKAAKFVKSYSYKMSEYIYAITPLGSYPLGLTNDLCKQCDKIKIPYTVEDRLQKVISPSFEFDSIIDVPNTKYKYRDYQYKLIKSLANNGRGVIISPTRSGKSLVIAGLIHNVFQNVHRLKIQNILIVVPNVQLVLQFESDLQDYGLGETYHIQSFTANTMNKKNAAVVVDKLNIYIANVQYLLLHGDELPIIDMIFMDEIHTNKKGNQISKLIKNTKILHKFGCTGTLPESKIDVWQIIGTFGPVVDEVEIQKLQQDRILADVKIFPIKFIHHKKINFRAVEFNEDGVQEDPFIIAQKAFHRETMYLDTFEKSNIIILNLVKKLMLEHSDWNSLILFDYTDQGEQLYKLLDYTNKHYVDGSTDVNIRRDIVNKMDKTGGNVLIAQSKTFSTGITISRLNVIFLFNSGKSATKIIQSIGRGLRRQNKTSIIVFDISHNYQYSESHFNDRIKLYKDFYNLVVGINYHIKTIQI